MSGQDPHSMRCFALASSFVIAMLVFAGAAGASTLAVGNAGVLRLVAKHGEVNHVTVRDAAPAGFFGYVVSDTAGLKARRGCIQESPTQADCTVDDPATAMNVDDFVLDLGDLNDTSDVFTSNSATGVQVNGGLGDDLLSGGATVPTGSAYTVNGGPGDDTIDRINTNGDPIDINGGLGNDTISTNGTVVSGTVRGGLGADSITLGGDEHASVAATVDGGPGPDVIEGGAHIVKPVFGGFGNDNINLPGASSIDCGFGHDSYGVYEGQTATHCEKPLLPPSV
ncbi:MAG TPA: hypothetical protein VFY45_19100 [Baekduia sp.]|nr:hypothetical protein [Baekduia sp.]